MTPTHKGDNSATPANPEHDRIILALKNANELIKKHRNKPGLSKEVLDRIDKCISDNEKIIYGK